MGETTECHDEWCLCLVWEMRLWSGRVAGPTIVVSVSGVGDETDGAEWQVQR